MIKKTKNLLLLVTIIISCNSITKEKKITEQITKKKEEIESFDVFFKDFSKDSLFQTSRIVFPINVLINSEASDGRMDTVKIEKKSWYFIDFQNDKNAKKNIHDKFQIQIQKINKENIIYTRQGIDNGILISYNFQIIKSKWYLTQVVDESD